MIRVIIFASILHFSLKYCYGCGGGGCPPYPVHGEWGQWSTYIHPSSCNCVGMSERVRHCDNPSPQHGGRNCDGQMVQRETFDCDECSCNNGGCDHICSNNYNRNPSCDCRSGYIKSGSSCTEIQCDTSGWPAPSNGIKTTPECQDGKRVSLYTTCIAECNNGYRLKGSASAICGGSGSWSPSNTPTCEEITCSSIVQDGRLVIEPPRCSSSPPVGTTCTVYCKDGFSLLRYSTSTHTTTCGSDGSWKSGGSFFCRDLKKPVFTSCKTEDIVVTAGKMKTRATATWEAIKAKDNDGSVPTMSVYPSYLSPTSTSFEFSEGTHDIVFTAKDTSGNEAKCSFKIIVKVVRCPLINHPKDGRTIPSSCSTLRGSRCNYECNDGYNLTASSALRECTNSGIWTGLQPTCQKITCPYIPIPNNGKRTGFGCSDANPAYKTLCSFACDNGYKVTGGSETRICKLNGQWTGQELKCEIITCRILPQLSDGLTVSSPKCIKNISQYNDECRYLCASGYLLLGPSIKKCSSIGQWSPGGNAYCKDVSSPTFGNTCPSTITTFADRHSRSTNVNWTDPSATDNAPEPPSIVHHGKKPGEKFGVGHHTIRYMATDKSGNTVQCIFQVIVEVIKCLGISAPQRGTISCSLDNVYGSQCKFSCNIGHALRGSAIRTCEKNGNGLVGQWTGNQTHCEAITCPIISHPQYGFKSGCPTSSFGEKCLFYCFQGYQSVSGSSSRTCLENGKWTGSPLVCRDINCTALIPSSRQITIIPSICSSNPTYQVTCQYSCPAGYSLNGLSIKTCLASGKWNHNSNVSCTDIERPRFTSHCPHYIDTFAQESKNYAVVDIPSMNATDNSGELPIIKVTGLKANYSTGTHGITITATDASGNKETCQIKVTVKLVLCSQLSPSINHGRLVGNCGNTWGSTCNFECNAGFNLTGSSSRTCKAIPGKVQGEWSGTMPFCTVNRCRPLEKLMHGYIYPFACTQKQGPVSDTECHLMCKNGFSQTTPIDTIICGKDTIWKSNTSTLTKCKDITPPQFTNSCPQDIIVPLGQNGFAMANWTIPIAEDNTNVPPIVTVQPSNAIPPFAVNQTITVVYEAKDAAGNSRKCQFRIIVEDNEGPRVVYCPTNVTKFVTKMAEVVTWKKPKFVDNSNIAVKPKCNRHSGDTFYWGVWQVHCRGYDNNPNNAPAVCSFPVTVSPKPCPSLNVPNNGAKSCAEWMMGMVCTPLCNARYDFKEKLAVGAMWVCGSSGTWMPSNSLPDCSEIYTPGTLRKAGELRYFYGNCHNKTVQLQIKLQFIEIIKKSLFSQICLDPQMQERCNVTNVDIECGMQQEPDFDDPKRRKRSMDIQSMKEKFDVSEPDFDVPQNRKRRSTETVMKVKFEISSEISNSSKHLDKQAIQSEVDDTTKEIENLFSEFQKMADNGSFVLTPFGQSITPINGTFSKLPTEYDCGTGQIYRDRICTACPIGTFFNATTKECLKCSKGWYQDTDGQETCIRCPSGTSTMNEGSKNSTDCKVFCKPGFSSPTGFEPCIPCPKGTFQSLPGQARCDACINNTTTALPGSTNPGKCKVPCSPGTFSSTGLRPCTNCNKRSYQPRSEAKSCLQCPGTTVTLNEASTNASDCIEINECLSNPCRAGSTCRDLIGDYACHCKTGFTGKNCEKDIDDCASFPCENNGTCKDGFNSFSCECLKGFNGSNCEIDIDECQAAPCLNNATCRDMIGRYECFCQAGYEGARCEKETDECLQKPCQNDGTCIDKLNAFECQCPKGFRGVTCEENIDDCSPNPCKNAGNCKDGIASFNCSCNVGYTGTNCEKDINECLSLPCQNNGTCFNEVGDFSCVCMSGYNGAVCEQDINECLSSPCKNGGACSNGIGSFSCHCKTGFEGDLCESDINECTLQPCMNNGTCLNTVGSYTCNCVPGFTGQDCEVDIDECLSNPCLNNGSCENLQNGYVCNCIDGFSGQTCQININECDENPCKNNATCHDGINSYKCTCSTGYKGEECEIKIDYCEHKPCENGGQCRNVEGNFECTCADGYSGKNCSQNMNECQSNPCNNNGHCEDLVGRYRCSCFPGFTGNNCEHDVDDCIGHGCMSNGTCVDGNNTYHCQCDKDFTGKYCEITVKACDSFPCFNGATCNEKNNRTYTCTCPQGFTGYDCSENIDDCKPQNPCQNGGVCTDLVSNYTCACPRGFFGSNCENFTDYCLSSNCSSHGACINLPTGFKCNCTDGFYGPTCQLHEKKCLSNPCKNGGTCHEENEGFNCTCKNGFTGSTCGVNIDYCKGHQCLNNATCVDKISEYLCLCQDGFNGTFCEQQLRSCRDNPCKNNGTCEDIFGGYKCKCSDRYEGATCNIDTSPCAANPCLNDGQCKEFNNTTFKCICKSGYSGKTCQTNIDDCVSAPCPMHSNCIDKLNGYICQCVPSHTGKNCETRLGDGFDLVFPNKAMETMVHIPSSTYAVPNMMRLSIALWVKVDSRSNRGSILTYRSPGNQSEMIEISFSNTSLRVVIQNDVLDRPVNIRGGKWHFIGASWSRFDTDFSTYFDGKLVGAKKIPNQFSGLALRGGGEFVLGKKFSKQNQAYTTQDAFVGVLHQVNVWHVSVPGEAYMWNAAHSCSWPLEGNVYPWLTFMSGAKQGVLKKFPTSCEALDICKENCSHYVDCHKEGLQMVCTCKPGFTGALCDININDCVSNPCQHGKCLDDVASYKCQCENGFYGSNCQKKQIEINKECPSLGKMKNGRITIESYEGKKIAHLKCNEKYKFRKNTITTLGCGPQTAFLWNKQKTTKLPKCLSISEPIEITKIFSMEFPMDPSFCKTSLGFQKMRISFEKALMNSIANTDQHYCFLYGQCKLTDFTVPKCSSGRNKRSNQQDVGVNFALLFKHYDNSSSSFSATENAEAVAFHVKYAVTVGTFEMELPGQSVKPRMRSFALISKSFQCQEGYVGSNDNSSCVACPSGTFQYESDCNQCPIGQYQANEGSASCITCPDGKTTTLSGATGKEQCSRKTTEGKDTGKKIIIVSVSAVIALAAFIAGIYFLRKRFCSNSPKAQPNKNTVRYAQEVDTRDEIPLATPNQTTEERPLPHLPDHSDNEDDGPIYSKIDERSDDQSKRTCKDISIGVYYNNVPSKKHDAHVQPTTNAYENDAKGEREMNSKGANAHACQNSYINLGYDPNNFTKI